MIVIQNYYNSKIEQDLINKKYGNINDFFFILLQLYNKSIKSF